MQVTVEETSGLGRTIKVQIPEDTVQQQVDERLKKMSRQAKIPGFRPGKVPAKIIRDRFGGQAREEVVSELLRSSFGDALMEKDLNPAGTPQVTDMKAESGAGLEYTASFEIYPEVELKACSELSVTRISCEIQDSDVDAMVERLREQNREWIAVERAANKGDRVQVNYTMTADTDDESAKENEGKEVHFLLGNDSLIADFDEQMQGAMVGQHLEFAVTFPDDYTHKGLAGNKADFVVDILAVEEASLPEVDEEFIKKFGVDANSEGGSMEIFRAELLDNLNREKKSALQQRLKADVLTGLYEMNELTLPQVMVDSEFETLLKPYQEAADKQGADVDDPELAERLAEEAKRRVSLSLILSKIIEDHSIQPDDARVRETIESIASTYEYPDALIEYYMSDEKRMEQIRHTVLEDQVVDWVVEQATVAEQSMPFTELMGGTADA